MSLTLLRIAARLGDGYAVTSLTFGVRFEFNQRLHEGFFPEFARCHAAQPPADTDLWLPFSRSLPPSGLRSLTFGFRFNQSSRSVTLVSRS